MVGNIDLESFIARWRANEGGAERANYVLFLTELCALLGLPPPEPANASHHDNDYVFERSVTFHDEANRTGHGRIDLYKRGCFVLEAKQSRERGGTKEVMLPAEQAALPGFTTPQVRGRRSAQRGWDVLMRNAREQAEQYARALPTTHGWPPFLLVCDVGHAIEVFADFSGQGKNYRQFPDRAGFRIYLDDLRDERIRERLHAIWLDPLSLDPARHAASVTRDIAKRLASVSKLLEKRGYQPEPVAHFLMRCLFTMFAEDTGLLDAGSFAEILADASANPDSFAPMLEDLWRTMDTGGFSPVLRRHVRRFNGGLFAERTAIPLKREEIGELYEAAQHVWTDVEPAIFGTLLEQALDKNERRRLGAHYTPRAYVERLVAATVIEPLQREWETEVLGTVERERTSDPQTAIRAVHDFHVKLAGTRVLDPACGTGNFLYVSLELMKRLEGEVLEVLSDLGGQEALALETESVHPRNFLGLELNPRAAAIAELVLWLGYLQWQMRNGTSITDPVLERLHNITVMDAVLKHDPERPKADRTGTEIPNPRRPDWPQADYIVGNPPFIGAKWIRDRLGDAYAGALWAAHPKINKSADFVMYWWDRAAEQITRKGTRLKRFGFVSTNSITQKFSRRIIQSRMDGRPPLRLVMAIPDHPWTRATPDAAAVRIAMTVAEQGMGPGYLLEVSEEADLQSDAPSIQFRTSYGFINADLTIGNDTTRVHKLLANEWIASRGVGLFGPAFMLTHQEAVHLGLGSRADLELFVRPYLHGRDIVQKPRGLYAIDLYGLEANEVRQRYPEIYQYLLVRVKPARDKNRRPTRQQNWWLFGELAQAFRENTQMLSKYIVTPVTSKYRLFTMVPRNVIPDDALVTIASDDPVVLGVLSSAAHNAWSVATMSALGPTPRYVKSNVFDPFPFPDVTEDQYANIGVIAEELDTTRKEVLEEHPDLTLTTLYNLRKKLAKGDPLNDKEEDQRMRGRVDTIAELHDRIDAAVANAYGWPPNLSDKEMVTCLVSLNAERHAEEQAGTVQWLRPEYQISKAGLPQLPTPAERGEQIEAMLPEAKGKKPTFPRDAVGQTAAVLAELRNGTILTASQIGARYSQGRRAEPQIAATLTALERLGYVAAENGQYRLRRAA